MEKQVKSNNIHNIVEILREDPILAEDRESLYGALSLPRGKLPDIKREYPCDTPGFLTKALDLWISNRGINATFGNLVEILGKRGFKNAAGELTKALYSGQFDSAVGVSGTNSNNDSRGFSFEIPEPILNFTGREQELTELHKTVMSGEGAVLAALSGMGGIGKTTLAVQYIWKYHEGIFSNVIWINAENWASLRESFSRLAKKLKLTELKENPTAEEFKDFIGEVFEQFTKSRTLLVFDNAENYEEIKPYLPRPVLKAIQPYVLITSRNNEWVDKFKIIQLGLFTPEEALKFLENYLELTSPEEFIAAEKLCESLGYLPIAVRQAGAYIKVEKRKGIYHNRTRDILEKYTKMIEKNCKKLLDYEYWKKTGEANEKTTFVTWNITMENIKNENAMCERIMELIAYLEPHKISTIIILAKLDDGTGHRESSFSSDESSDSEDDSPITSAINLLDQYSIIKKNEGGFVSVHRLVQKVIRWQNREREAELLAKTINIIGSPRLLIQHCLSVWKCALENEEVVKQFPDFGIKMCESLIINSSEGKYEESMKLIKKTIEKFKTVHPRIGASQLAVMYFMEITILCKSSSPNVVRILELGKEILLYSEELIRAEKSYSYIIGEAAEFILPFIEGQAEKDEFKILAYEFFRIYFNVVKFHNETFLAYMTLHSMYIVLMAQLNKTEEAVQMTRELVENSKRIGDGTIDYHSINLKILADNLTGFDKIGFDRQERLVKYSLELNEELYKIAISKNDRAVKETLIHKAYCLFLLRDFGSKEDGLKILETEMADSEKFFESIIGQSRKFLPISYMLVEFGYFDLALKFFKLMKELGRAPYQRLDRFYVQHILIELKIENKIPVSTFEEILNKVIIALEEKVKST